jgi:hypothetical protein
MAVSSTSFSFGLLIKSSDSDLKGACVITHNEVPQSMTWYRYMNLLLKQMKKYRITCTAGNFTILGY